MQLFIAFLTTENSVGWVMHAQCLLPLT